MADVRIPKRRTRCKWERLSRARAREDRKRLPELGYYFDADAARHVIDFFERYLHHHEGEWAGQRFVLAEWQKFIVRQVFGWMRPDGSRRYRTAYIEIPRKNGKSTFLAGLGLYLMVADNEPAAQVFSSATKKDQAKIVHEIAKEMLKRSPALQRFVTSLRDNISCERMGSFFRPLGADSKTLDGLNAHGNLVDELHAHRDRRVYDVLTTSMGARRQPLTIIITTAGLYDPESIGWQQHQYAKQVLDGVFEDETLFAFIAAADEGDDWTKPSTWWKANPNLGTSVKWAYFVDESEKAKRQPSYLNTFLRLHTGIWTTQVTRWMSPEAWKACPAREPEPALWGRVAFAGLDLSSKIDLTAFALVLPADDGFFDVIMRFWVPKETALRRAETDRVPYDAWIRDGWVQATEGSAIDYSFVEAEIATLAGQFEIQELAFDPWSAMQTAIRLGQEGMQTVEFRQGYRSMSEPCKELEALVMSGKLRHGDHPVLNWMANNVAITEDPAGNIKMAKDKSTERIDGMVAVAMGLGRALVHEVEEKPTPGLFAL